MPDVPDPLAAELLRYLTMNPDAKDTLEGIYRWWLSQPEQWNVEEVRAVLDRLVQEGAMTASSTVPGLRLYGPSPAFVARPETFVKSRRPRKP